MRLLIFTAVLFVLAGALNIFELGGFLWICFTGLTFGATLAQRIGVAGWFIGFPVGIIFSLACWAASEKIPGLIRRRRARGEEPSKVDGILDVAELLTSCIVGLCIGMLLFWPLRGAGFLIGAHLGFLCSQLCFHGLATWLFNWEDKRGGRHPSDS